MAFEQEIQNALTIALPDLQVAHFAVIIDGEMNPLRAGFQGCSAIGGSLQSFTINEPGDRRQRSFPQRVTHKSVTLVKGLDVDRFLYRWFAEARDWRPGLRDYHRTVTIYALQRVDDNIAIARLGWDLFGAYPTEWSGPENNAMQSDMAFEQVVLNYEEMEEAPIGATINLP